MSVISILSHKQAHVDKMALNHIIYLMSFALFPNIIVIHKLEYDVSAVVLVVREKNFFGKYFHKHTHKKSYTLGYCECIHYMTIYLRCLSSSNSYNSHNFRLFTWPPNSFSCVCGFFSSYTRLFILFCVVFTKRTRVS